MAANIFEIDQRLLDKIRKGDRKAFNQLFEKYHRPLYKFAFSFCNNSALSDEAVADVFITIWLNKSKLKIHTVRPYLFTITKNNVLQALKKNPVNESWDRIKYEIYDSSILDEESESIHLTRAHQILAKMPPQCRLIFEMQKIQHFKYAEIAEILNISIKTVENQMGKALKIIHENINAKTADTINTGKTNT